MRIKELVNEISDDNISELIERNCSEILSVYRDVNKWLFRGFNSIRPDIFQSVTRGNRKVMSSSQDASDLVDQAMQARGFGALRSNSIFTVSAPESAKSYSIDNKYYIIFPFNGFDFAYSTYAYELIVTKNIIKGLLDNDIIDSELQFYQLSNAEIDRIIEYFGIKKDNLEWPLKEQHEVWIHGRYYALNMRNDKIATIVDSLFP